MQLHRTSQTNRTPNTQGPTGRLRRNGRDLLLGSVGAAIVVGVLGCGDGVNLIDERPEGTSSDDAAGSAAGATASDSTGSNSTSSSGGSEQTNSTNAAEPLYAILAVAQDPDGRVGYLTTISSLDEGSVMSLDEAIEIPGGGNGLGIQGYPSVWVTSWSTPTIIRYDLNEQGVFEESSTIDFSGLGLSDSGSQSGGILELDSAWFFSPEIAGLVHWDPNKMEIIGTVPLGVDDPNLTAWDVVGRPNDDVVLVSYYFDSEAGLGEKVGLAAVDTTSNTVISTDEWEGCNYAYGAGQASDGTAYFAAEAHWVLPEVVFPGDDGNAVPCALRVRPDATTWDRDFQPVDLGRLVGDRQVTGNLQIVSDDLAFFQAWHEELAEPSLTPENYDERVNTTPAWKWYTWDFEADQATEADAPATSGRPHFVTADGRTFLSDERLTADNGGRGLSPMYEMTPSGTLETAFIGTGSIYNIVRVR